MSPVKPLRVGDLVRDRRGSDSPLVVVALPQIPAEQWQEPSAQESLAERNPDYPADSSVVVVVPHDQMDTLDQRWKQRSSYHYSLGEVYDAAVEDRALPRPRVEKFSAEPEPDSEPETEPDSTSTIPKGTERLLCGLAAELEDWEADIELLDGAIEVEKLGETYRITPNGIEGEGRYRDELYAAADPYFDFS